MASYNENPQQQQDADRDLDDWLHLTGWHNVADRNAKLAQFRDIHYDYETRRRELMRGTFDDMPQGQGPYESSQNIELAGNAGNECPPPQQQQQQFTLPIRPAPGAHHQPGPAGPSGPTGPRARERSNRSRSPVLRGRSLVRGRSPAHGRSQIRGGGAAGGYRQRDYPEPRRPIVHPIRDVDLGDWDDTRFFMIKSTSLRNIFACHDDNLWATSSVEKGNMLSDAYMTTKNVILFFSANGSQSIQGYVSRFSCPHDRPPSGNIAKPEWYPRFSHHMSEPFPVEWLSKNTCPDRPMKGLLNRLNRNDAPGSGGAFLPPTRSRDCQEVDSQCGRDMLEILKRNAESAAAGTGAGVAARAE
ncbi:splicing factor [Apiospora hydei]|uniref:Splicing factor n=1 Tax=Apiospora hydei TaxID=1337664 RepID=A0ABR1WLB8_9PEZI